jgi:hypothetical protein
LFSERDISSLDDHARHFYQKACRRPNRVEHEIQKALRDGKSVRRKELRTIIDEHYGNEVLKFFDYAQSKTTAKRRSGDSSMLHQHATQARIGRAFPQMVQGLGVTHDTVEDNSDSIADVEFYFWEQASRRWRFSEEQVESLRLLTNIYRMILKTAEDRAAMRDKGYARKLLLSMDVKPEGDVKEQLGEMISHRRQTLQRRQLYVEEPYLRDLEAIIDVVDVDGLAGREAVELIGEEAEMYASQKLYARALKREIESQRDFIDQSVDRLLLHRQFRSVLGKLNGAKYSYMKAVEDDSATEKQGVLLKLLSGLYEAMELMDESLGTRLLHDTSEKAKRIKKKAKKCMTGIDDAKNCAAMLAVVRELSEKLDLVPTKMRDVSRLKQSNGLVSAQTMAERALSFERAMGPEYKAFDSLLLKMAYTAEQIVIRNQLMYLNALSPSLSQKKLEDITTEDMQHARDEAVDKLKARYAPYFDRLLRMIETAKSEDGVKFLEVITLKAYEQYISDIVSAEEKAYAEHSHGNRAEPYRGLMLVKIFDAVDNVRTAPMDRKNEIERLVKKVLMIEAAARRLEEFYMANDAAEEVVGGIRGSRLVLINELHASLIENAKLHSARRDDIFREGMMVPYLLRQATALYEKRRKYLG